MSAPVPKRDIGGAVSRYSTVLKRANTHIITFVCVSNLFLHDIGSTEQLFKDWLSASVYGAGDVPSTELAVWLLHVCIGGTWFLLALFWARMIAVKLFKTKRPILLSILCFFL